MATLQILGINDLRFELGDALDTIFFPYMVNVIGVVPTLLCFEFLHAVIFQSYLYWPFNIYYVIMSRGRPEFVQISQIVPLTCLL